MQRVKHRQLKNPENRCKLKNVCGIARLCGEVVFVSLTLYLLFISAKTLPLSDLFKFAGNKTTENGSIDEATFDTEPQFEYRSNDNVEWVEARRGHSSGSKDKPNNKHHFEEALNEMAHNLANIINTIQLL